MASGDSALFPEQIRWQAEWKFWLPCYVVFSLLGHLFLDPTYGFALYLVNGGFLLAGSVVLFDHGRSGFHYFLLLAALSDLAIKVYVVQEPLVTAIVASLTLIFQAWAGCWLIFLNAPASILPNSLARVISFLLYGAAIPSLISAAIMLALFKTGIDSVQQPMDGWLFWIWWWVRRMTSLVLIAPLVLLLLGRLVSNEKAYRYLDLRFLAVFVLTTVLSAILFATDNTGGEALPTHSYLLIPLMLFIAVWLPLEKSLMVVLAVTMVAYLVDSQGIGASQGIGSMLVLSLYLMINAIIVWMLGALIRERQGAYRKLARQNAVNSMKSRLNEFLIKEGGSQAHVFREACGILVEHGVFLRACIEETCPNAAEPPGAATCMQSHTGEYVQEVARSTPDCFMGHKASLDEPVYFSCLDDFGADGRHKQVIYVGVFPLQKQGQVIATLSLFAEDARMFEPALAQLICEMLNDIGFALAMYDSQARMMQTSEVFLHSKEAIMITDNNGIIMDVNGSFTKLLGYEKDELVGQKARILSCGKDDRAFYKDLYDRLAVDGFWSGQTWKRAKGGEAVPLRGTISAVFDGSRKLQHLISIMEDASVQIGYEQRIEKLANFDSLTQLPNRVYLRNQYEQKVARADSAGDWSLIFVDLDGFKHVNDALGHHVGDELLKCVAGRMKNCIRQGDMLCRFGGDEFVVLVDGDKRNAEHLIDRFVKSVGRPYQIGDHDIQINMSVGVAVAGTDGKDLDELIQAADTAMYSAKATGGSRHCFYSPAMKEDAQLKLMLRRDLQKAIEQDQLFLMFQPKVQCVGGALKVVGVEALVRWQHPQKGLVSPAEFIPAAEENGQIADIDRWVMAQVLNQLGQWYRRHEEATLPVSVNVSASLFSLDGFVEGMAELLSKTAVPAWLIELEVTEHVAMENYRHTLETMKKLKEMGVGLAIDDFGTGHSNLAYLRDFPVDVLKIDIAFVKDVHTDSKKQALVRAMISMARSLSLKVIAEGVETEAERAFLESVECTRYQGYLFYRPMLTKDIDKLFAAGEEYTGRVN